MTLTLYEPPAAAIDWNRFCQDAKKIGRITRPKHIREAFDFSQSTVMAIWQNKSVGVVPFLRVCKRYGMNPLTYLCER